MSVGLRRASLAFVLAALAAAAGAAEVEPEEAAASVTPVRTTFDAWLEVYNDGEKERLAAFVGERFSDSFLAQIPADALVAFHQNVMRDQGELTLDHFDEEGESVLVALLRDAVGGWIEVTLGVDPHPPHKIVGMRIVPAEEPAAEGDGEAETEGEAEPAMSWPDSRAGAVARGWVEAFNADGEEAMRSFEAANRTEAALGAVPMDERIQRFGQIRGQLGAITPSKVLSEQDDRLALLAQTAFGPPWVEIGFELEGAKLSAISIQPTSPDAAGLDFSDAASLADVLVKAASSSGAPGMAAAWVADGEIAELAVAGVREAGGDEAVATGDLFHLGSVTKSITATMIASLVEDGVMSWDDTIGEALGDLEPREEYRDMTVMDLLQHRARIQPYLTFDDAEMERLVGLPGNDTEQRAALAREVLAAAPGPAGMTYSNAGYSVAALIAERKSKKSWPELVAERVFAPLEMTSAGFGWPATAERSEQPRGHFDEEGELRAQGVDEYVLGAFLAPAGNVHASITDLARYAAAHLAGLRGADGALQATTVRRLHNAPEPGGGQRYAAGWGIGESADGTTMHWHNGSAGTFYALVALFPDDGTAFVLVANAGAGRVEPVARRVMEAMRTKKAALAATGDDSP